MQKGCLYIKCGLGPSETKTTKKRTFLLFLFTETRSQILKNADRVRGILRSQLLIIYGNGVEGGGSQRWKTSDKATPFHCHSFQPPFIRAVNKEQKKIDFSFPVRGLSSRNPVKRKEGTFEGEAERIKRMQTPKVRGHKCVALGAKRTPFCMACKLLF